MRRVVPALALFLLAMPTSARGPASFPAAGAGDITAFLAGAVERGDIPGIVALVVDRDGVLYHEAFGTQDAGRKVAMQKDTIFRIASMTKPVTSMGVMQLVEEGKLSLDDEASRWIPWLKAPKVLTAVNEQAGTFETTPATRAVTIRQLMTHTSGLGYSWSDPGLAFVQRTTKAADEELPLVNEPGARWTYGMSTRVLGDVIEKVSGQRIDAYLQARVFGPLGMRDTFFEVPREKSPRVVTIHQKADGRFTETPNPETIPVSLRADGGLLSTAADYARFIRMILDEGELDGARVLAAKTVRDVRRPHMGALLVREQPTAQPLRSRPYPLGVGNDTWGLGFQLAGKPATRYARSRGSMSWAGIYNTEFWIDPERQVGAILLMQMLPFYDEQAIRVLQGFEERVYRHLR